MKKAISLVLALIMCLSLCACGESSQQAESGGKKEDIYASALLLLEESQGAEENASEKVKEAHELLVSLGEYEDAKEYLAKITQQEVCVAKEKTNYDAFGQPGSYTISYQYDTSARLASEYDDSEGMTKYFEYDAGNRVVSETRKVFDQIIYVGTYSYNGDGQCTLHTAKHNSGLTVETFYHYDENGNQIKESYMLGDIDNEVTFAYNDAGLLIEKRKAGVGGYTYKYEHICGDTGDVQKRIVDFASDYHTPYIHTENYTYDNGNLTLIETYDEKQNLVAKETYTYETLYFYNP